MATGLGLTAGIGGLAAALSDISKLDESFQSIKTTIPELEHNQNTYNQAMKDSFGLAQKYGESVENVNSSLLLMGRGYHELATSEALARNSLKLSIGDNFSPEVATKSIEAVIGAYGKQNEAVIYSQKVMDSMAKVAHTSQVSANDLAEALLRSAAAAHTVGISFDELNAMIAVIARNTGLSGQTIGDKKEFINIFKASAVDNNKQLFIITATGIITGYVDMDFQSIATEQLDEEQTNYFKLNSIPLKNANYNAINQ